jgi:putative ABC transport system ATP-binding protein
LRARHVHRGRRTRLGEPVHDAGRTPVTGSTDPRGAAPDGRQGLSISGLRHAWGARVILDVPSFVLPAAGHAVVVGPSGCGKTTLLSLLAGLAPLQAGRVSVAGESLDALAALGQRAVDRFRARHVGLVPQQPMLFGVLDVLDNLLAAQHFAGRAPQRDAALALLAQLGLEGLQHRRPRELSRGQQQRVALARALVNRPSLILADEPTANLDDDNAAQALALLVERARALGAMLLVATHDARVRGRFETVLALGAPGVGASPQDPAVAGLPAAQDATPAAAHGRQRPEPPAGRLP